ncbi:uncharacterized protein [Lolium perenne]|uniref:uncharacterized protein n=1 Tax=Lolium perenne TaxID=4522 RepID=UPI0021F6067B|nr:uncharacterized protein LOC127294652 [Lolium perenne]
MKIFEKIIHIDCLRWESRRALQRIIAEELQLPQGLIHIFDGQDEEDDFRGVYESSRAEIGGVSREILRVLLDKKCLVVIHNVIDGIDGIVEFNDFGIPPAWFGTKVLWRSWVRPSFSETLGKLDDSHLFLYNNNGFSGSRDWKFLLQEEASEIARYTCKLGATREIAMECCLYAFSLMDRSWNMGYTNNCRMQVSNYWVCDGIIQAGGESDQAWEVAAAMHQHLYLGNDPVRIPYDEVPKRWICSGNYNIKEDYLTFPRETTSLFLAGSDVPFARLPNDMFHQSVMLRVLRLYDCTFNFSSPPFHCCHGLRFLGLELCKDQPQGRDEQKDIPRVGFFRSLWVVDICNTDWELVASPEITEEMVKDIREIHMRKARFWHHNFPWRQLQNLRTLRIIEPTHPWEIQVFPRLSRASSLKTIVLVDCVALKHVTCLPPSLESFSFGSFGHREEAKVTYISVAGCPRMVDFSLGGTLPNLEELNLSGTSVKTLDLDYGVHVPQLRKLMMLGCQQLCAVLWPEQGMSCLSELCIDTRGGDVGRKFPDSNKLKPSQAYVAIMDMRFIQSLVLQNDRRRDPSYRAKEEEERAVSVLSCSGFCWNKDTVNLTLSLSASSTGGPSYKNLSLEEIIEGWGHLGKPRPPLEKSVIPNPSCRAYPDIITSDMTDVDHNYNSAPQLQPSRCHVDIGEGISKTDAESIHEIKPIIFVMNNAESLHVHENSSITTVIPERVMSVVEEKLVWRHLKRCRVERCSKMRVVFSNYYDIACFHELESFCAVDLPMAHCIWSKGRTVAATSTCSFAKLQSIHLYSCPRLAFVLPLSWSYNLTSLETIHIVRCDDLRQVFPVDEQDLREIATDGPESITMMFPNLKHIYMHELYKLQHICKAKMSAPKLETVKLRGCWGLRRLPSVGRRSRRPVVDCEKDWWDKLKWDGLEAGHDPSLFEPRHSSYNKKPLPRVSVLR